MTVRPWSEVKKLKRPPPALRIAFDVDGVLADFVGAIRACMYLPDDWNPKQWDIAADPLIGEARKAELYELYKTIDCERFDRYPDAKRVVASVHDAGYRVCFATSPMRSNRQWVADRNDWINDLCTDAEIPFYDPQHVIYQTDNKLDADAYVLIDDKPEHVQAYANAGRVGILLRRPWNERVRAFDRQQFNIAVADDLTQAALIATFAIDKEKRKRLRAALNRPLFEGDT